VPEQLQLKRGSVAMIPGFRRSSSIRIPEQRHPGLLELAAFKTVRADLDRQQLQTLRLRETETGTA
jgi:hypothetical protein